MTSPNLTRATFLAAMLGAGVVAAAPDAFAARDPSVEQYVQTNATSALQTLGDRSLSDAERQQTFNALVNQFSDIDSTAQSVLGTYAPQVWRDPALKAQWVGAFREFLIATYEDQLNQFSGGQVAVTGSTVLNSWVIVNSRLTPHGWAVRVPARGRTSAHAAKSANCRCRCKPQVARLRGRAASLPVRPEKT